MRTSYDNTLGVDHLLAEAEDHVQPVDGDPGRRNFAGMGCCARGQDASNVQLAKSSGLTSNRIPLPVSMNCHSDSLKCRKGLPSNVMP